MNVRQIVLACALPLALSLASVTAAPDVDFDEHDQDENGYLDNTEWSDADTAVEFERTDRDGDGRISREEAATAENDKSARDAALEEMRTGSGTPTVTVVDWRGRGTRDEAVERQRVTRGDIFAATYEDNNQNASNAGETTPAETGARRRPPLIDDNLADGLDFSTYDTDDNGMLDRGEASDSAYLSRNFDAWDRDGNGLLEPAEARRGAVELSGD